RMVKATKINRTGCIVPSFRMGLTSGKTVPCERTATVDYGNLRAMSVVWAPKNWPPGRSREPSRQPVREGKTAGWWARGSGPASAGIRGLLLGGRSARLDLVDAGAEGVGGLLDRRLLPVARCQRRGDIHGVGE